MALNEKTLRVLIKFDADTSKAKEGMRGVQSEADKTKKSIGGIGDAFGALDGPVERAKRIWGDFSSVVSAGAELFKGALERGRLEAGAMGVSLDSLRKSSAGLKSDMNLLRDAVTFNQTALKGNAVAMQEVERAERALIGRGNDAGKVHEALTGALTKLETEGLRPLGISVDKAGLSMDDAADRAELFKRVMSALRQESAGVNDEQLTQQERVAASGVAFENATDQIKKSLGEMVVALTPLIAKIADLVAGIAKLPKFGGQAAAGGVKGVYNNKTVGDISKSLFGFNSNDVYLSDMNPDGTSTWEMSDIDMLRGRQARLAEAGRLIAAGQIEEGNRLAEINHLSLTHESGTKPADGLTPTPGYKGKSARDTGASQAAAILKAAIEAQEAAAREGFKQQINDWIVDELAPAIVQADSESPGSKRYMDKQHADDLLMKQNFDDIFKKLNADLAGTQEASTRNARYTGYTDSKLAGIFGPIEDFNLYQDAFKALGGAVTSAMDAWISGSESAGTAIKKFIANAIKAEAGLMAVEAIKHLAYALGSLAFGNPSGAAAHGLAAAKFGAGAVLAAVVAREMGHGGADYGKGGGGGGGGSGGGSSAPAPSSYGGGTGGNGGGRTVVYVVGDPFDENASPRQRQQNMRSQIERVTASRGGEY